MHEKYIYLCWTRNTLNFSRWLRKWNAAYEITFLKQFRSYKYFQTRRSFRRFRFFSGLFFNVIKNNISSVRLPWGTHYFQSSIVADSASVKPSAIVQSRTNAWSIWIAHYYLLLHQVEFSRKCLHTENLIVSKMLIFGTTLLVSM